MQTLLRCKITLIIQSECKIKYSLTRSYRVKKDPIIKYVLQKYMYKKQLTDV